MEECLINNKVCPNNNLKCKECKLNDCKETIRMCDKQMMREEEFYLKKLKEQLPIRCRNCAFLEIIDLKHKKVRCPYMIKKCVIK